MAERSKVLNMVYWTNNFGMDDFYLRSQSETFSKLGETGWNNVQADGINIFRLI